MAEFEVTLSAMTDAAKNIKAHTQNYMEEADQTHQAAQRLIEIWTGDASNDFISIVENLYKWMGEMAGILETYSAALDKARSDYENADVTAAKNFG